MTILSTFLVIFGILISLANFVYAIGIFKNENAKNLPILFILIFFIGSIFWVLYGFELQNMVIIFVNELIFISLFFIIFGWFIYGREIR